MKKETDDQAGATGSCLCGAVHYRINSPVGDVTACHCSQCRKQTGHFLAAVHAEWEDVDVDGKEHLTWYASSPHAERVFCSVCGSPLFWVSPEYGTGVMAGSLDKPTGARLTKHIFVADKGDYYDITDGLPQFDGDAKPDRE